MRFVNNNFIQQSTTNGNRLINIFIFVLLVSQIVLAHHKTQHITQNFETTCSFCIIPISDGVADFSGHSISLLNPEQIIHHITQVEVVDYYTFLHYSSRAPPIG